MRVLLLSVIAFLCFPAIALATGTTEVQQAQTNMDAILSIFSIKMLINIAFAIVVIIATVVISKIVKERIFGILENSNIGDESSKEEMIGVISRTINILILITGFSLTLWILWVDLGIFMWGIWFGIGFTLRTFLTNFISGIIIVTQGSYHIWDMIEVDGKVGNILKINSLFTAIQEFDGVVFNIPNVRFFEENVRNYHTNDKRRIEIEVSVDYSTDIMQAKKVLQKVLSNFPMILQAPASDIIVKNFSDKGIILGMRFWISSKEDFVSLKSNITETVNHAFHQTDIAIPYPQMEISYRDWENNSKKI